MDRHDRSTFTLISGCLSRKAGPRVRRCSTGTCSRRPGPGAVLCYFVGVVQDGSADLMTMPKSEYHDLLKSTADLKPMRREVYASLGKQRDAPAGTTASTATAAASVRQREVQGWRVTAVGGRGLGGGRVCSPRCSRATIGGVPVRFDCARRDWWIPLLHTDL